MVIHRIRTIDAHAAGVSMKPLETLGRRTTHPNEIFFDGVFVPADHVIGEEKVAVESRGKGRRISSAFSFEDRGTKVELNAALELDADGLPIRFTSKGKTYRLFSTDVDVVRIGDRARIGMTTRAIDP